MIVEAENSSTSTANGVSCNPSPSAKAGKHQCSSSKSGREQEFFCPQPFILVGPSRESRRLTHFGWADGFMVLLILWSEMLVHPETASQTRDTPRNNVQPNILALTRPVKCTRKRNHYTHLADLLCVRDSCKTLTRQLGWESLSQTQASRVKRAGEKVSSTADPG